MASLVLILAIALAVAFLQGVRGRLWQRQHTYMEEFWHSNGW